MKSFNKGDKVIVKRIMNRHEIIHNQYLLDQIGKIINKINYSQAYDSDGYLYFVEFDNKEIHQMCYDNITISKKNGNPIWKAFNVELEPYNQETDQFEEWEDINEHYDNDHLNVGDRVIVANIDNVNYGNVKRLLNNIGTVTKISKPGHTINIKFDNRFNIEMFALTNSRFNLQLLDTETDQFEDWEDINERKIYSFNEYLTESITIPDIDMEEFNNDYKKYIKPIIIKEKGSGNIISEENKNLLINIIFKYIQMIFGDAHIRNGIIAYNNRKCILDFFNDFISFRYENELPKYYLYHKLSLISLLKHSYNLKVKNAATDHDLW